MSSVTNMENMFRDVTSFNADIAEWDVSNVADMYDMFLDDRSFDTDISKWDVLGVTDVYSMFLDGRKFDSSSDGEFEEVITNCRVEISDHQFLLFNSYHFLTRHSYQ